MTFAIRKGGKWFLAHKKKAEAFGEPNEGGLNIPADTEVWSEVETTAFLGLVGDEDPDATVEGTAVKELEEETGFTAERVERLGDFHASPGMVSESFTLVRAHEVSRSGEGGGTEHEDIKVHLVARADIPNFVEQKRAEGFAIDVKLLLLLASSIL
jgi:hypothetical protein